MSWWFNIVSFGHIHVYALIMYKINVPSTGIIITIIFIYIINPIGGVMDGVLASTAIDGGFFLSMCDVKVFLTFTFT